MLSFDDFHHQRAPRVLHYARAILGADAAEDACQEAWLKAWRNWGSADPTKLDSWLLAIVRNCCTDRLRSLRPATVLDQDDGTPVAPPDDDVITNLELAAAWLLLQRLPAPLREVLWLREAMDLSYTEIATIQDVPLGTVMSRLHTARKKATRLLDRRSTP